MKSQRYGRSHPRSGFTPEEDCLLVDLVAQFGNDSWATIASYMEKRNARQCKDRYTSYLSPTINNGPYSEEEDDLLRKKYNEIGPKWVKISKFFPNRTDISVKCRWAVLNRRDMKMKEKKLTTVHSKSQKSKNNKRNNFDNHSDNDSTNSSSPVDPDFVSNQQDDNISDDTISIGKLKTRSSVNQKRRNYSESTSKSFGSTMTIRKRNRKHFDYNDNDNEDQFNADIDGVIQPKEQSSDIGEPTSSFSTTSAPSSLTSTDNDSSANSPGANISNHQPFLLGEVKTNASIPMTVAPTISTDTFPQNQAAFIPVDSASNPNSSSSMLSFNPAPFFDTFSSFNKSNDEILMENHTPFYSTQGMYTNQTMNIGIPKNDFNNYSNYYGIRNSTENFIKFNNNSFNHGNYINNNNFQPNKRNVQFPDRSSSMFVPSVISDPNMNPFINDKKRNFKSEDEIFADDLNWDICWDIPFSDVKDNQASVNLFYNTHHPFE